MYHDIFHSCKTIASYTYKMANLLLEIIITSGGSMCIISRPRYVISAISHVATQLATVKSDVQCMPPMSICENSFHELQNLQPSKRHPTLCVIVNSRVLVIASHLALDDVMTLNNTYYSYNNMCMTVSRINDCCSYCQYYR